MWRRYTDGIFSCGSIGQKHLNAVMKRLNKFHSTAKFTAEYFEKSVPFLDVTTNIENKVLKTDLFSKSYGHTPIQSSF